MPAHPDPSLQRRRWAFAAVVRRHRKNLDLSQEKLAGLAGCDRQSINRIENARYSPTLDSVQRLADALGVTAGQLLEEAGAEMTSEQEAVTA